MDIISAISYIGNIFNFVYGFLIYRILSHFARRRSGIFWQVLIYISCTICSGMVIFPNDFFNITIDLLWLISLMLIAFQGSVWQRLAAVAVLYPLIISQNFFVMDMLGTLGTWLGWPMAVDIFCTIADPCLHLIIWYVIYRFFAKHLDQTRQLFDDKIWILLTAICLASLVSITTCIYFTPHETYKMWPAAFACFATNLGCVALAEYFIISIRQNMERKNLMLQKSYYEELEQNQTAIRKLRHDMNNHLTVIHSLLRSGNHDEAEQYMKEIETQLQAHSRVFCKKGLSGNR